MTWPLQKDCTKFYGNPRGSGGKANPQWEAENLVLVKCPWTLRFEGKFVSGIRIHKKCADSLKRVLAAIWEACGRSQAEIDRIGMSKYGGSYNFRSMRGSNSLSMHSYGIAVDFDPSRNGLGDATPAMDHRVVRAFEAEGWEWGGHWSRPDGMHFQAARTRAQPKRLPAKPASSPAPIVAGLTKTEIERLQQSLSGLGYNPGWIDGIWGTRTRGALLAFKADAGLPLTDAVDAGLWEALARAPHREVGEARASVTARDLSAQGDEVVKAASGVRKLAVAIGAPAAVIGVLDNVQDAAGYLDGMAALVPDIPGWLIAVAVVAGAAGIYWLGGKVERAKVQAVRSGLEAA